jgi:hypothetical protein
MSATQYQDVIKKGPLSTNVEQTEMIKRVGKRIQSGVEQYMASKGWSDQLSGFNWEFNLRQGLIEQMGMTTLSAAIGQNPSGTSQLFMQAVGMGSNLGMLKFSRQHESEADHIGLIFMAMAGYDPNNAPIFWKRMVEMNTGQKPPEFMSTHPSDETRIKALEGWIPEALSYYKK